ncbi:Hypothetical predicted protein [Olea europaea subsp. europaea]|uniref:Uncharacterized protein n=1 Tax=Olea europaea subsp. europaea TaxID=158383 RepID=A0A8S0SEY9_OLEEU|nr:Hypothetical predicted protein [Olea europaea subsp. europaea]
MGTEVLRPQDCLVERRYFSGHGNLIANTKQQHGGDYYEKAVVRPERAEQKKKFYGNGMYKKSWSSEDLKSRHTATLAGGAANCTGGTGIAMGKVTILRRGESVDSLTKMKNKAKSQQDRTPVDNLAIRGTPAIIPKQIRLAPPAEAVDMYAGSAFSMSPSPRALPLPSFFNKKKKQEDDGYAKLFEYSATRDLRRLLRLE